MFSRRAHRLPGIAPVLALGLGLVLTPIPRADDPTNQVRLEIRVEGGVERVYLVEPPDPAHPAGRLAGTVKVIPKGTPLFHWSSVETGLRWQKAGRIDSGELDVLLRGGDGDLRGGGVYVSRHPLDSLSFGPTLTVFEAPRDMRILMELDDGEGAFVDLYQSPQGKLAANRALKVADLSGTQFTQTWLNLVEPRPLQRVRGLRDGDIAPATIQEYLREANRTLVDLVDLELRFTPAQIRGFGLEAADTFFSRLLLGVPLSAADRGLIATYIREGPPQNHSFPPPFGGAFVPVPDIPHLSSESVSPVARALRAEFQGLVREQIARMLADHAAPEGLLERGASWGLQPADFLPGSPIPRALALSRPSPRGAVSAPLPDFAQDLLTALQSGDFQATLAAMAAGRSPPWDPGQLRRWREALAVPKSNPFGGDPLQELYEVHRRLTGAVARPRLRDEPRVVGGPILRDELSWYRVSALELETLRADPYLIVTAIPDSGAPSGSTFLARHESPSARTFRRFETLLAPELLARLIATEGTPEFRDPKSPVMRELTAAIIESILRLKLAWGSSGSAEETRMLEAIAPFPRENERTLAAFTQRATGIPNLRSTPRSSLTLTALELAADRVVGRAQWFGLEAAIRREQARAPAFPKFFDLPELWQVGLDVDTFPDPPAQFVKRAQAEYRLRAPQEGRGGVASCVRGGVNAVLGR